MTTVVLFVPFLVHNESSLLILGVYGSSWVSNGHSECFRLFVVSRSHWKLVVYTERSESILVAKQTHRVSLVWSVSCTLEPLHFPNEVNSAELPPIIKYLGLPVAISCPVCRMSTTKGVFLWYIGLQRMCGSSVSLE